MNKYNIKVSLVIYYDKNFEIFAKNEEDAELEALRIAKYSSSYLKGDRGEWTSSDLDFSIAYVEEEV